MEKPGYIELFDDELEELCELAEDGTEIKAALEKLAKYAKDKAQHSTEPVTISYR